MSRPILLVASIFLAFWTFSTSASAFFSPEAFGEAPLLSNTTSEKNESWSIPPDAPSWARDADSFSIAPEADETLGASATKVVYSAPTDWAVRLPRRISVEYGDVFEISCRVRVEGAGSATTGVILYSGDRALSWSFGGRTLNASSGETTVVSKFVVPKNVDSIEPRLIGAGAATVRFADYTIRRVGTFAVSNTKSERLVCENEFLKLEAETSCGAFSLLDKRTNRRWTPIVGTNALFVQRAVKTANGFEFDLIDGRTFVEFRATIELDPKAPEVVVRTSAPAETPLEDSIVYPYPFATKTTERIVLPVNEGISFPTTEREPLIGWIHLYGGHGLCMSFWGIVDDRFGENGAALAGIIETPDDAAINMEPRDAEPENADGNSFVILSENNEGDAAPKTLSIAQHWQGQKRKFGYDRTLRLVSFDRGGHVAVCKRYRQYAEKIGLVVSFDEKVRRNPNLRDGIDRLVGAANIWCWDQNRLEIVDMLRNAGFDRILWSAGASAEELEAMNRLDGVLTSRYDIYQDAMNPERFPELNGVHSDWTSDAWPHDLCWDSSDGRWTRGWEVEAKDPTKPRIPCGVLCDAKALPYAEKRISKELETKPYRARFLDTTTASAWRECWNPDHPITRTESKSWRMQLLGLIGSRFDLVCGSETGHDASVPYCDFYEGMASLGPYRVPESGRDMARVWTEVPDAVRKYQVGEAFRLPLFELVYHECVVSYWYWGDYNNKLPEIWKKRDLFNALYGIPPMYMFSQRQFEENRDRFIESYRIAEPVSRLTGRVEMVDHRILTPDRTVQQSVFANGVEVFVNFGKTEYVGKDGFVLAPESSRIVESQERADNKTTVL